MDASVFSFFEEYPNRENRDEKNARPASHSEGCDFGFEYDFEYESPESDSPRTIKSSASPAEVEDSGQQLTPDYASPSDSDDDESYSPSSRESSSDADSSDSVRTVFGTESSADDSSETPVQISPIGVGQQLYGFQKNDVDETVKSDISSARSKSSKVSTDTTVYTDDKETVQPRPSPSDELITFHPVNTRKATPRPIAYGRRATHETRNNNKNLPSKGNIVNVPQQHSRPEAAEGPFVKTISLAENSGIRDLKAHQPDQLTPCVRLPGIPIRLKSEAIFQNGELEIRIIKEGRKWLKQDQLKVNIVIVDQDKTDSKRRPTQRKRKGATSKSQKKKGGNCKPTDKNVVENRANWPEFNTALSEEANKRYMNRLGI